MTVSRPIPLVAPTEAISMTSLVNVRRAGTCYEHNLLVWVRGHIYFEMIKLWYWMICRFPTKVEEMDFVILKLEWKAGEYISCQRFSTT